ncbi:unnamed protein product [Fraxinus pennsylvanica]|uniref:RNase H type-1 domain-containing protein n=1 Tax=Fraxinus pennsylvanica TaxID=56036 RepID=A0AAD2A809_9LAMI|nr:unnamed protein product [Fraxinus pennsylvanica]
MKPFGMLSRLQCLKWCLLQKISSSNGVLLTILYQKSQLIPADRRMISGNHLLRGSFKLNIDAAIFENQRKAGLGLVIRNDLGSFIAARVVSVQGIVDPLLAETLGVREALSWIKAKFPEVQTIEMDALLVYNALLNDEEDNSYFGILIDECRFLAKELSNLKFSWVRRSTNQVAHTLAKAASSSHVNVEWSYFPPLFISNVLLADLMNE